jgi:glycosyltransferase involved in cell wall biosynthesis
MIVLKISNLKVVSFVLNNFTNDSRVLKEARSLQNNGYDVTVVALHEKPLAEREQVENFQVHRIKLKTRPWPKYKPIQLIKYFEFIWKAVKLYKKADILHCNDLNALPIGVLVKKFFNKNAKIVYDAHEYETEKRELAGLQKIVNRFLELNFIKYADRVMTVSDSIANEYARLYGIEKPSLVLNCPLLENVSKQNKFRESLGIREDQTIFLYQGGFLTGRGIGLILDAFAGIDSDKNVIVFMGSGPLERKIKAAAEKYPHIFYHPSVSPDVLLAYTSSADFGILFYENTCLNHFYCSPNKIFEYLMAGLPVIVSNLFEMKRLVESHGFGIVANEDTTQFLRTAIDQILIMDYDQLVENVNLAKNMYNWENQEKTLLNVYTNL